MNTATNSLAVRMAAIRRAVVTPADSAADRQRRELAKMLRAFGKA